MQKFFEAHMGSGQDRISCAAHGTPQGSAYFSNTRWVGGCTHPAHDCSPHTRPHVWISESWRFRPKVSH